MRKMLYTIAVSLGITVGTPAQNTGGIDGIVRDDAGRLVQGSTITCRRIVAPRRGADGSVEFSEPLVDKASISSAAGAYSFRDLPPGRYTLCAYGQNVAHLASCEWYAKATTVQVEGGRTSAAPGLVLRTGVVVNILASDNGGLLKVGRRFRPGIYTDRGYYKSANLQGSASGNEIRFAVAIPPNVNARLFIDSDLRVDDEGGRALVLRKAATPITFAPGTPQVTFRLVLR